jgi:hypothetical protein
MQLMDNVGLYITKMMFLTIKDDMVVVLTSNEFFSDLFLVVRCYQIVGCFEILDFIL